MNNEHIPQSLRAATQALGEFERSLRAAGFAENVAAYQRMSEVLLAQRLVAATEKELAAGFGDLGETAKRIYGLLNPYVAVMRRLAALAPPAGEDKRATVHAELRRRGTRGTTAATLRRATRLSTAEVNAALSQLEERGEIHVHGTGTARRVVAVDADTATDNRRRATPARRRTDRTARSGR